MVHNSLITKTANNKSENHFKKEPFLFFEINEATQLFSFIHHEHITQTYRYSILAYNVKEKKN